MDTAGQISLSLEQMESWIVFNNVGSKSIYLIGIFLILGLSVVILAKKYGVPIVVGYVFLGILLSPDLIKMLPFITEDISSWYTFVISNLDYVTEIALAFIAFTIGSELSIKTFKRLGKSIFYIVCFEAVGAFVMVTGAVYIIGKPLYMALLFGSIASATAPAATVMVLKEYNAEGPLTSTIMAVVGIDDAAALIIFSLISPAAYLRFQGGGKIELQKILLLPLFEIFASIALGLAAGYTAQYLLTLFEEKTKKVMTVVALIIGTSAVSLFFDISPLIANMAVGFAVRNFAKKNLQISEYLDTITIPLYAMFFMLAGTEIRFSNMGSLSFLLIAFTYLTARMIGKVGGSTLAARISGAPESVQKYIGFGLFPQSGVAIALAYTVQRQFSAAPEVGLLIFNTLLLTAAITEVIGPLATKYAVIKSGEAKE
ncbi:MULTISPECIES: cation:proton antiporter [unclassified Halanaerobium]|uniref:cation:proton antiporter n=1 Tax=unclassified Halanaerobium TaxID=2641197 RepID=UPI000DF1E835|nr:MULTISPECIES: cation:proton antiporter [unclassified Halanaerobium]RCW48251.1 transporter (CPA2 family) [Halanaerobium sp. MA284_MarDTE_T2]RCW85678.1 transporter (CPA2 family) [Halanaerobium sp. DL-01]